MFNDDISISHYCVAYESKMQIILEEIKNHNNYIFRNLVEEYFDII